ncbi:MAG: hypothetical protein EBT13_17575, partial [Rhodobacteraceae bacterium]|nr:hypothetical protein [Paracoccaceae bacterium]
MGVSLYNTGLTMLHPAAAGWMATGKIPRPTGNTEHWVAPYGAYPCSDGKVFTGAGNDRSFAKLMHVLGASEAAEDPRFRTNADRVANREALDAVFGSIFDSVVDGIAGSRKLTSKDVLAFMANGPLLAQEAQDGGLVDQLAYRDEFEARIDEEFDDAEKVSVNRYLSFGLPKDAPEADHSIAMIHAIGPIQRGEADAGPFGGEQVIGGDTLAQAIRGAAEDDDIDAILMRIDSPGGSYVASDTVWREVIKAKETGKPIIASMGNTAASGGYFIAMAADRIFAAPGTITGSIGVIMSTLVAEDAFEKLDVNWVTLTYGERGDMYTITREPTEEELDRINRSLDAIYDDFTSKAALGRDMPVEAMRNIAKGRIWSGVDAE